MGKKEKIEDQLENIEDIASDGRIGNITIEEMANALDSCVEEIRKILKKKEKKEQEKGAPFDEEKTKGFIL